MRTGHKKLLVFEIILLTVLIINSFVSNILSNYYMPIFLLVALVAFRIFFGFTKQYIRYSKDIIFDIIILLIIFFILFYVLGIFIGYARIDNYLTWYGLKTFILPLVSTLILREVLRYYIINKCEDNMFLIILTVILMIFVEVSNTIYYTDLKSGYGIFIFIAMYLLPAISTSVSCTYVSKKVGYKPVLLYLFVIELYQFIIPIIPNPDKYLTSVIHLILPIILLLRTLRFFKFEEDEVEDSRAKKAGPLSILIPTAFIITVVYFTSGYFKYYAVAVATGSMEPNINVGDIVIIEQLKKDYDKLDVGDVLAFRYNGVIVVHRIIKKIHTDDEYFFYTKGDNNNSADNYVIKPDSIVGVVNHKINYLGLPTVWLNNL